MLDCEVRTVEALEEIIGKPPAPVQLKVINFLDAGALAWLAATPLMFLCFAAQDKVAVSIAAGQPGFAWGDETELILPQAKVDRAGAARVGDSFGSVLLLPGISEVLRINGKVSSLEDDRITVAVEECMGHCGKALIRSDFWKAAPIEIDASDPAAFARAARFMALASVSADGHADVSPKGDLAGDMALIDDGRLWFPDRPGNKRVDSFHNILTHPQVAGLLLVPGSAQILYVEGTAHMTTDEDRRQQFAVGEKMPKLVTALEGLTVSLDKSEVLAEAAIWPMTRPTEGIDAIQIGIAHLKLNKGLRAKVLGSLMSVPGLMHAALDNDYKKNLF